MPLLGVSPEHLGWESWKPIASGFCFMCILLYKSKMGQTDRSSDELFPNKENVRELIERQGECVARMFESL